MEQDSNTVDFRVDRGRRILRILPTGSDDLKALLETIPAIVRHVDFKPVLHRVWDLTSMDWKPTREETLRLVHACRAIPRHLHAGKNALVVERPLYKELQAGSPELIEGATGRIHRAFPSFFEAEIWLLAPLFTPDSRGRIEIPSEALVEMERGEHVDRVD